MCVVFGLLNGSLITAIYHGKPSVVLYRISRFDLKVGNFFKTSRFISLVNLLADRELFPEFLTDRCESVAISRQVVTWLDDARLTNNGARSWPPSASRWPPRASVGGRRTTSCGGWKPFASG